MLASRSLACIVLAGMLLGSACSPSGSSSDASSGSSESSPVALGAEDSAPGAATKAAQQLAIDLLE